MDLSKRLPVDLLLGALLLLLLGLPRIEGASLVRHRMHHQKRNSDSRERYYEPCGSKTTAAPLDALLREVIIEDPLEEHLDILSKESEIAKRSVQDLMTRYLNERLQSTNEDLEQFKLDGLPTVPSTTLSVFLEHGREQTHKSLQDSYDRLVTMDMFLHVIKLEENMHHENLGYGAQLEGISQSHIFSILCRIRVAMSQHSMDYDTTYIKTVARKEVRDLTNDAVRSISDYIILRELKKILHHMEMEFSALKQNLSKTRRT